VRFVQFGPTAPGGRQRGKLKFAPLSYYILENP
jgi:hypothetical protein